MSVKKKVGAEKKKFEKADNDVSLKTEFKASKQKKKNKKTKQILTEIGLEDTGSHVDNQEISDNPSKSAVNELKDIKRDDKQMTDLKLKKKHRKEKKNESSLSAHQNHPEIKSKKSKRKIPGGSSEVHLSPKQAKKGRKNILQTLEDDPMKSDSESEHSDISEFDMDSYPSDSEDEMEKKQMPQINSDDSSDESSLSDEGSVTSKVSEFDMDSYPSDTDDEMDKKRGLPVNAVPSAEIEENEKRTIFVGNLPYSVERTELKKWFSKFGKVECVRLRSAPIANPEVPRKVAVIKKTFHESRSNIHAYIRFRSFESAENALQANGAEFGDHILRVDHSKHEGKYDPKKAVFIGNVPFSLEENGLRLFFSECGEIDSVRIVRDKNTGVGKGFAYVNFKCSSSVPLALKLDGEVLEKRELRVKPVKYMKKNAKPFQRNQNQKFRGPKFQKNFKRDKNTKKPNKYQGEMSKRITKKFPPKKSTLERKQEKIAKIFAKSGKKDN